MATSTIKRAHRPVSNKNLAESLPIDSAIVDGLEYFANLEGFPMKDVAKASLSVTKPMLLLAQRMSGGRRIEALEGPAVTDRVRYAAHTVILLGQLMGLHEGDTIAAAKSISTVSGKKDDLRAADLLAKILAGKFTVRLEGNDGAAHAAYVAAKRAVDQTKSALRKQEDTKFSEMRRAKKQFAELRTQVLEFTDAKSVEEYAQAFLLDSKVKRDADSKWVVYRVIDMDHGKFGPFRRRNDDGTVVEFSALQVLAAFENVMNLYR